MPGSMRVAQLLNRMDSGGIEAVVCNYYRHIDHSKIQFDFYCVADSTLPQRAELERLGAGLYAVPAYTHPFAYHRALYRALKERGYTIAHVHISTMSVFALLAAWHAGVPVRICHNHSTANWHEGAKTLLKYLLRPFNKPFATHWFACGEAAGRWMYGDRAFDAGKVTVMPNAIDAAAFAFDAGARQRVRAELGIPEQAFTVGLVGRFTYAKNHAFLLEIFAALRSQRPDARLLLVGDGELEQAVRARAAALGLQESVIFTGARTDVGACCSAMDVFCMPSRYEGMPVAAWEAQANGLPCVLSPVITKEAACGPNARFAAADWTPQRWAQALLEARRGPAPQVPDIAAEAAKLQTFYLEKG